MGSMTVFAEWLAKISCLESLAHLLTDYSENLCNVDVHCRDLEILSVFTTETWSWSPINILYPFSNCPFSTFSPISPHVTASYPLYFRFSAQLILLPFTSPPPASPSSSFLSYVCTDFFRFLSASATCVVAMFMCLYITEHLLFQQGPHGLKCQSRAAARQAHLCSGLVLCLLPVPALLVV